ncbi:hypothetical protein ABVT39_027591 [Epinephelus coioides]
MDPAGGCSTLASFHTVLLRETGEEGGTAMIDLSHLTEEEQGVIMAVLRRDAELKKAEEERIRRLEKLLDGTPQSDPGLKYLTGEWFYEAKSRRHMDKIHGSEIIWASMKQRRPDLDASPRVERSNTPSIQGSDIIPPPKPARCFDELQPQGINGVEQENVNSAVRSPRTPRQNPFNRASFILVEPPENDDDMPATQAQESSETEPISPLRNHTAEASQTSGGSLTSEGSSVGFRPVPKKRTFLTRCTPSQPEINYLVLETQGGSVGIVPAPRRSLQRGSSESSNQSFIKVQDEMPQESVSIQSQSAQPSKPLDENFQQAFCDVSQVSPYSSLERERHSPSVTRDRLATFTNSEAPTGIEIPEESDERDEWTQREYEALNAVVLHTASIQDSDRGNGSSVEKVMMQEELSLPQSTVDPDPPVSYDLHYIDKSEQQTQKKSNQKHAFQLSTQSTSPTGDEDSIAKVLDWFNRSTDNLDWTGDDPKATKSSDKHVENSKLRGADSLELKATDRISNREVIELQEEVKKDMRDRMQSQEVNDNNDESQPPQISHLMSFWEKSNAGPKIRTSKTITPTDKGQKPLHLSAEKEEEKVNKPYRAPDIPSDPGTYNGKGIYYRSTSNHEDEGEQDDTGNSAHLDNYLEADTLVMNTSTHRNNYDPTNNSDYLKSAASPQESDRRGSDTEILCVTTLGPQPKAPIHHPQPDSISQSRETPPQDELSESISVSQLSTDPDSEKLCLSRSSPYMDYEQGDIQVTPKTRMQRSSSEDVKLRNSEDISLQSSISPKQKEDTSSSTHSNRQSLQNQESTAEKIKQLRSFWEQEGNKPIFYTSKPKALGNSKVARGANLAKLNKRHTKSEFDLTLIGNDFGSDEEDSAPNPYNFTVLPLNQRIEKPSPLLGKNRTQFNSLREFWGEAASDTKKTLPLDKPKSPKRKEQIRFQLSSQELKYDDPEVYCVSETTRPAALKSSPPLPNQSKVPHDRQVGSRAKDGGKNSLSNYITDESKRSSKDSDREDKSTKPPSISERETRSLKYRRDSFSNSSSRKNSMRRAASMFALSVPDEQELQMDVSPIHSLSRKHRQNAEKGASPRRLPEETETPRARACVPKDYRHYLGMTDDTSIHTSIAPAVKAERSEGMPGYEFDVSGPVRASTPVSSEEHYSRRGGKTSQRPLWANYSSSDAGQESSVSSTSETWSSSRNSSTRENEIVRKALRRAEARPKSLAKSVEDITAALSPREEEGQDPADDMRRISNVSSIPSHSSYLYSDPEHLKKMSKSVPSFLQDEDIERDNDFPCEDVDFPRRLTTCSSLKNLTGSSGMSSLSSLSGSVMTMYSGDFGNVEVQGYIQFSINYILKLREFHIFVAECQDLAAVDPKRGRSDPYVKSYLSPDKANLGKRKTSVKKKTLNPKFNEILRYRVRMEYLRTQTLILSVWHHDTFGRNSFLGEVDLDLSKWDFDHTQMNYLALKARTAPTLSPSLGRGEIRLALRFLPHIIRSEGLAKGAPNTGEVHIWVKECKNLPLIRPTIDPYVKCFVLPDTSRKSRQKTRVMRRTVDPAFNHTMVYDGIRQADLLEACVELTVWDRDRLASNLLGGLRIGAGTGKSYGASVDWMDSTPHEAALWERMMATPNQWVEDILPLRVLNSSKTTFK